MRTFQPSYCSIYTAQSWALYLWIVVTSMFELCLDAEDPLNCLREPGSTRTVSSGKPLICDATRCPVYMWRGSAPLGQAHSFERFGTPAVIKSFASI